jgi:hypothetical protein
VCVRAHTLIILPAQKVKERGYQDGIIKLNTAEKTATLLDADGKVRGCGLSGWLVRPPACCLSHPALAPACDMLARVRWSPRAKPNCPRARWRAGCGAALLLLAWRAGPLCVACACHSRLLPLLPLLSCTVHHRGGQLVLRGRPARGPRRLQARHLLRHPERPQQQRRSPAAAAHSSSVQAHQETRQPAPGAQRQQGCSSGGGRHRSRRAQPGQQACRALRPCRARSSAGQWQPVAGWQGGDTQRPPSRARGEPRAVLCCALRACRTVLCADLT